MDERQHQQAVSLRDMAPADLTVLFAHQQDPEATRLAAFPSRDWDAFKAHWTKVLTDDSAVNRTILVDGEVAGYVTSWVDQTTRKVGYWLGRQFWGKGVATAALREFTRQVVARPLTAYVASHNLGSIRVLEKCGFVHVGPAVPGDDGIEEVVLELRSAGDC
jgi:RimJ/RimL family protein N-acetyltransferase